MFLIRVYERYNIQVGLIVEVKKKNVKFRYNSDFKKLRKNMFSLAQFGINEEKKSWFRKKNYLVFRSNNHQFVCTLSVFVCSIKGSLYRQNVIGIV